MHAVYRGVCVRDDRILQSCMLCKVLIVSLVLEDYCLSKNTTDALFCMELYYYVWMANDCLLLLFIVVVYSRTTCH